MKKYLYLIKKQKIKSWLKFWLLTNNKFNSILSEILEGITFILQNSVKRYFNIFQIFGNSVQDGTPSPENPVPINSVADDVNLLNRITCEENKAFAWITGSTFNETNSLVSDYINVKVNQKLIFTYNAQILFYDNNKTYLGCLQDDGTTIAKSMGMSINSLIVPNINDIYYMRLGFRPVANNNQNMITANIKVQKGTTATTYSPYGQGTLTETIEGIQNSYNYTFQTEPLRSLPNGVRDSLEDDGIHRRVAVVDMNTLNFQHNESFWYTNNLTEVIKKPSSNSISANDLAEKYVCTYADSNHFLQVDNGFAVLTSGQIRLNGSSNVTPTGVLQYELAEEVIEPYTEEQQVQYNKIKELYTFNGTTNIYSTDEVSPYLKIQYYMKGE